MFSITTLTPNEIISSKYQTKEWRQNQVWYQNGKHQECERYQMSLLSQNWIHFPEMKKTNVRLNVYDYELRNIVNLKKENMFEWSENFDAIVRDKFLFNLKFICDQGGSQARTMRETFHFIRAQISHLKINKNYVFINILDGDFCYRHTKIFRSIIPDGLYSKLIFIGDLEQFIAWWNEYYANDRQ